MLRLNGCIPHTDAPQQGLPAPQPPVLGSVGKNRVFSRNGKGGTVRLPDSVPQSCDAMMEGDQALVRHFEMEQAVETILLEVGENPLRQVGPCLLTLQPGPRRMTQRMWRMHNGRIAIIPRVLWRILGLWGESCGR